MPKMSDSELKKEAAKLISEFSGFTVQLYERLYQRAGDAWQFRRKVDELQARSGELMKDLLPPASKAKPKPEEEEEDEEEVAGLA